LLKKLLLFLPQKKQWNAVMIITEIQRLHELDSDLNAIFIRDNHLDLFKASINKFGNWNFALKQAGFNPEEIRLDRKTSSYKGIILEQIVEELYSISGIEVERKPMINGCQPDFVEMSKNLWVDVKLRSWSVGIDDTIAKYLKHTNRLQIIFLGGGARNWNNPEVQFIWLFDKFPLLNKLDNNSKLIQRIRVLEKQDVKDIKFKIWSQTWSRERIIQELLDLHSQGKPINTQYLLINHRRLYSAIGTKRYFNDWSEAIRACGLNPDDIYLRMKWSRERIIQKLLDLHSQGKPINKQYLIKNHSRLYNAITSKRYFNDWSEVTRACGLNPDDICLRKKWSRERIIQKLLDLHSVGEPMNVKYLKDKHGSLYGAIKSKRYFIKWADAIKACGLEPHALSLRNSNIVD
jgi:hypothetical protein